MGSRIPASYDHYQSLPAATTIHTDMKPMDYIGLYILVTVATMATVNGLFRIYF